MTYHVTNFKLEWEYMKHDMLIVKSLFLTINQSTVFYLIILITIKHIYGYTYDNLNKNKFDVMLVDFTSNECSLALSYKLNIPAVFYITLDQLNVLSAFTTSPAPPSYIPRFMSITLTVLLLRFLLRLE